MALMDGFDENGIRVKKKTDPTSGLKTTGSGNGSQSGGGSFFDGLYGQAENNVAGMMSGEAYRPYRTQQNERFARAAKNLRAQTGGYNAPKVGQGGAVAAQQETEQNLLGAKTDMMLQQDQQEQAMRERGLNAFSGLQSDRIAANQEQRAQGTYEEERWRREWEDAILYNDPTNEQGLTRLQDIFEQKYGYRPDMQQLQDEREYVQAKRDQDVTQGDLNIESMRGALGDQKFNSVVSRINANASLKQINQEFPDLNLTRQEYMNMRQWSESGKWERGFEESVRQWQQTFDEDRSRYQDSEDWREIEAIAQYGSAQDVADAYFDLTGRQIDAQGISILRTQGLLANEAARIGVSAEMQGQLGKYINQGYSYDQIQALDLNGDGEPDFGNMSREDYDSMRTLYTISTTAGQLQNMATRMGIGMDQMTYLSDLINRGYTLDQINNMDLDGDGSPDTSMTQSQYDSIKTMYNQTIRAGNIANDAAAVNLSTAKYAQVTSLINSGYDLDEINSMDMDGDGQPDIQLNTSQFENIAERYNLSIRGLKNDLSSQEFASLKEKINSGATYEQAKQDNPNLTREQYNQMRETYALNLSSLEENLGATKFNNLMDRVNSGDTLESIKADYPDVNATQYNSLRERYVNELTGQELNLEGLRAQVGEQEWSAMTTMINGGASLSQIKERYPDSNISAYEYAQMQKVSPNEIRRYEFDQQWGLKDRELRIREDSEQSRQYWDSADRFSSWAMTHLPDRVGTIKTTLGDAKFNEAVQSIRVFGSQADAATIQSNAGFEDVSVAEVQQLIDWVQGGEKGLYPEDLYMEAAKWYEAKYGTEPNLENEDFKEWARGEYDAAHDSRLTNPIDASLHAINSSEELDASQKEVWRQVTQNPSTYGLKFSIGDDGSVSVEDPDTLGVSDIATMIAGGDYSEVGNIDWDSDRGKKIKARLKASPNVISGWGKKEENDETGFGSAVTWSNLENAKSNNKIVEDNGNFYTVQSSSAPEVTGDNPTYYTLKNVLTGETIKVTAKWKS